MAPLLFEESIVFPFNDKLLGNSISHGTLKNKSKGPDKYSVGDNPKIKVENEQDDNPQDHLNRSVHLCNRCWATFVGIEAYFAHRNEGCEHSQVFIEGCQNSNKELDTLDRISSNTNFQNDHPANNDVMHSREIKLELLNNEEMQQVQDLQEVFEASLIQTYQDSPNNNQIQDDIASSSSTMLSKHGQSQSTKMDSQEKSYLNRGTGYINPNFPSASKQPVEKDSTNNIQTHEDTSSLSSTVLFKHGQSQPTNMDSQEKFHINPNFPSAKQNFQWTYEHGKQPVEKVSQNNQVSDFSKKRTMNILSPEQLSTTLNTQPNKKIKMSESSKELSRELAEILRKQMIEINNEYKLKQNSINCSNSNASGNESIGIKLSESMKSSKELDGALQKQMHDVNKTIAIKLSESMKSSKELDAALQKQMLDLNKTNDIPNAISSVNYSGTATLTKTKEYKDSDNSNLFQKSTYQISFNNKYSESFKSQSELSNNSIKYTRNKNNLSKCRYMDSNENYNKSFKKRNITKCDSKFTNESFEYKRKNERFYKAINPSRQRESNFKSKTLVVYNLNMNTRKDWLRTIFQRYGNVRDLNIKRYLSIKRAKCVVEFEKLSDAEKTYQLCRNRIIDGAMVTLYYYHYSLDDSKACTGQNDAPITCSRRWPLVDVSLMSGGTGSGAATDFGRDYAARVTGKPLRHDNYSRYQRPGPYNCVF